MLGLAAKLSKLQQQDWQGRMNDPRELHKVKSMRKAPIKQKSRSGLRQGKVQNGLKEELLLERLVPGISNNQIPF